MYVNVYSMYTNIYAYIQTIYKKTTINLVWKKELKNLSELKSCM